MKVLLTAANGRTGRQVLHSLVARGADVAVLIRQEDQWAELKKLGAKSCTVGNMEDDAAIAEAVAGNDSIVHIGPPMHPNEVQITARLVNAAVANGIDRFIYYSVMHPLRREVRHHRLKLDAEEYVIESGLAYTIVQPSRYMQHLAAIWPKVVQSGVHAMPFSVEKLFNVVDLRDLADATAKVVTEPGHEFATYELAGPQSLSQNDMAKVISHVLNREVRAEAISLDELTQRAKKAGASEDRIEQMQIMNRHYDEHGFRGNPNVLRWLLGREPRMFEDYVRHLSHVHSDTAQSSS